ncbi:MAG: RsmD family RNA methyltransferase [Myxococcales bacterium]|nr:RsmD family RNA methyltransferase [Myxococcales bacterium]
MRIVAGDLGGRVLRAPRGDATRPTSEKVREALFSILGPPGADDQILDLFAGAGGLGLEALSRGARHATFVDSSRAALAALQQNVTELGVATRVTIVAGDAVRLATTLRPPAAAAANSGQAAGEHAAGEHAAPRPPTWRWVFIDPPYASDLAVRAAMALPAEAMSARTEVVIEHDRRNAPPDRLGDLLRRDLRRYGDTLISLYRPRPEQPCQV